jgi:hypothetical protein
VLNKQRIGVLIEDNVGLDKDNEKLFEETELLRGENEELIETKKRLTLYLGSLTERLAKLVESSESEYRDVSKI